MENFSFFRLHVVEKTATISGWKIEEDKVFPTQDSTLEGLKMINKLYDPMSGSVFVKNVGNENYTLFQITPKGKVKSYDVSSKIMKRLIDIGRVCGGCTELPYEGYKNKNDWCAFSRSIANLQE